ncbi:MAG: hypothetical protein C0434_13950 [Xanthomonadaceae bacterium]|nr:hypothetical protein [Xanthomonadaceae bacterium]
MLSSLLSAAIGLAAVSISSTASAQLLGGLDLLSPGRLTVGCPFVTNTAEQRNTGFLDDNASYGIAQIPLSIPDGASIRIEGLYSRVRYFSLQSYDGARSGNYIDAIADARITPDAGGALSRNVALLPTAAYGSGYTVKLRYTDPPANPAQREANTLYVGAPDRWVSPTRVAKQIIYRIYLPNPDADAFGSTPIPRLFYTGPTGQIAFTNTPDRRQCDRIEAASQTTRAINPAVIPGRDIEFEPITRAQDRVLYPNGDSNYLRAASSLNHGDIVVIRTLPFRAPPLPPLLRSDGEPDVRYASLCHYGLGTSAVVSCVADRDAVAQADGYEVHVISTNASRPRAATRAAGVNWQRWGDTRSELIVIRQILSRPGFAGDYLRAINNPQAPLSLTLGRFAPEITYCRRAVFDANAASGSRALIDACRAEFAANRR